jgi:hypothetical protein
VTISDDIRALTTAINNLAAVLDRPAAEPTSTAARRTFFVGDMVAVPVVDGPGYSPIGTRPWHAAVIDRTGAPEPRCAIKAGGNLSLGEIVSIRDVPPVRQCESPGCKQAYARLAASN